LSHRNFAPALVSDRRKKYRRPACLFCDHAGVQRRCANANSSADAYDRLDEHVAEARRDRARQFDGAFGGVGWASTSFPPGVTDPETQTGDKTLKESIASPGKRPVARQQPAEYRRRAKSFPHHELTDCSVRLPGRSPLGVTCHRKPMRSIDAAARACGWGGYPFAARERTQSSISASSHPTALADNRRCFGKTPRRSRRQIVDRDRPVRSRTPAKRMNRNGTPSSRSWRTVAEPCGTLACAVSAIGGEATRALRGGRRRASPVCSDDFSTAVMANYPPSHTSVTTRRVATAVGDLNPMAAGPRLCHTIFDMINRDALSHVANLQLDSGVSCGWNVGFPRSPR
jgi:hypothetical protein